MHGLWTNPPLMAPSNQQGPQAASKKLAVRSTAAGVSATIRVPLSRRGKHGARRTAPLGLVCSACVCCGCIACRCKCTKVTNIACSWVGAVLAHSGSLRCTVLAPHSFLILFSLFSPAFFSSHASLFLFAGQEGHPACARQPASVNASSCR